MTALHGMWDLSSPTRDPLCALCTGGVEAWSLNHWTAREPPLICNGLLGGQIALAFFPPRAATISKFFCVKPT